MEDGRTARHAESVPEGLDAVLHKYRHYFQLVAEGYFIRRK